MMERMTEITSTGATLRLDKWLWFARFCKSRALATKLCAAGKIRIGGTLVQKAHHAVRPGDVLTFPLGPHIRVIRILSLGTRRGPAVEARTLYEDLAPPAPRTAEPMAAVAPRDRGAGRPTKSERRATDRLLGDIGAED
jgi:ribosome-associated heat shock protein Hsp15